MSTKNITIIFAIVFFIMLLFYFLVMLPKKYVQDDLYDRILKRGSIIVGINIDSKPFGFKDSDGNIKGFDVDLAKNIAKYILKNPQAVKFVPVTHSDRILKASTGEVDIVIATMTITPQRQEIIEFSRPYDVAGQSILVLESSDITSITDLAEKRVGVIFGTTAEKNMHNLVPTSKLIGYKTYQAAYQALTKGVISAISSDDTILRRFDIEDSAVKMLPKRYSYEPYGIAFRKGEGSAKLKTELDYALDDMLRKNIIKKLKIYWGLE